VIKVLLSVISIQEENMSGSFEEPGSIKPPGLIGRLVRFLLGYICLDLFIQIVDDIPGMIERGWPVNPVSICTIILGLYLLKPVINIGFTVKFKWLPQLIVIGLTLLTMLYHWLMAESIFGNVFTAFLMLWMAYVFGHLGLSFVLAAVIKTPGCEMRSIPHLWSKISGKKTLEHYCPGPLTPIDEWEIRLFKK
jgi:hypothetical protein